MRLIDADEAKNYLYDHLDDLHMIAAQNAIDEMPTIDAQPVKHGKWLETHCDLICGVCKWEYSDELPYMSQRGYDSYYEAFAYCPHCGSRLSPPDGAVYEIEDFGGDTDGNGNG